jgi:hypothetical protein
MPLSRRRGRPPSEAHECDYRAAVARVKIDLEQASAMHGRQVQVSAAKVLDLLNPAGMWRYINHDTEPMPASPVTEDDVDPMTGCKPVTARSGPERVQDAIKQARGGPAPSAPQGYA